MIYTVYLNKMKHIFHENKKIQVLQIVKNDRFCVVASRDKPKTI